MAASSKILKSDISGIIKCLEYFDVNTGNLEFVEKFRNTLENGRSYSKVELYDIIRQYLNLGNKRGKQTSLQRYMKRGYSQEESRGKLACELNTQPGLIFLNKDEIRTYIKEHNPFKFNLDNIDFIEKFLNTIEFKNDYIVLSGVYKKFKEFANGIYQEKGFNKINKGYVNSNTLFYIARGYSDSEASVIVAEKQKLKTPRCTEYFINKGFSEEEAEEKRREYQTQCCYKSRNTRQYWINHGYSAEEAAAKAAEFSRSHSVWWKDYWISQGMTEAEACEKVKSFNPSTMSFSRYKGKPKLYFEYINKIVNRQENTWYEKSKIKLKEGYAHNISKSEQFCFDFLKNYVNPDIMHEPYLIWFPEGFVSENKNKYFYACDGYLKTDDGHIIIFEFDGKVFHQGIFEMSDKIRDAEILMIDEFILGFVRISSDFLSRQQMRTADLEDLENNIETKINIIKDAIEKIKNCEETVIRL